MTRQRGALVVQGRAGTVAPLALRPEVGVAKHEQVYDLVRRWVKDGSLRPGALVPSGQALARMTGYSAITCRRAVRELIRDRVLVRGPSQNARARVPSAPGAPGSKRGLSEATRALSAGLAARRRAAGLTQPELATLTGYSVTTVGHAETGRLWQSRAFWEKADLILAAEGELTRRYDAYRTATAAPAGVREPSPPPLAAGPPALARVTLHWSDGTESVISPPPGPGTAA